MGYNQTTHTSWIAHAASSMTVKWAEAIAAPAAIPPFWTWHLAHQFGWKVTVATSCQLYYDAGPPTSSSMVVTCALRDTTVSRNGKPVPARTIPALWPYQGLRPAVVLQMVYQDGAWRVNNDLSSTAP